MRRRQRVAAACHVALTVAPYALMRHVTGYVAAPGAARDASRGRLLVGAVRCGLPDIRDVELRLHAVASLHPRNTPDPRDAFITAPPLLTVRPAHPRAGDAGGPQRCVALDDAHGAGYTGARRRQPPHRRRCHMGLRADARHSAGW